MIRNCFYKYCLYCLYSIFEALHNLYVFPPLYHLLLFDYTFIYDQITKPTITNTHLINVIKWKEGQGVRASNVAMKIIPLENYWGFKSKLSKVRLHYMKKMCLL